MNYPEKTANLSEKMGASIFPRLILGKIHPFWRGTLQPLRSRRSCCLHRRWSLQVQRARNFWAYHCEYKILGLLAWTAWTCKLGSFHLSHLSLVLGHCQEDFGDLGVSEKRNNTFFMISMIGFLVNDDKPVDLGVRFSDKPISPDWRIEQIKQGELAKIAEFLPTSSVIQPITLENSSTNQGNNWIDRWQGSELWSCCDRSSGG